MTQRPSISGSMATDELAAVIAKAAAGRITQEEAAEVIANDCAEWSEVVDADGRVNLLKYAALLHRAIR